MANRYNSSMGGRMMTPSSTSSNRGRSRTVRSGGSRGRNNIPNRALRAIQRSTPIMRGNMVQRISSPSMRRSGDVRPGSTISGRMGNTYSRRLTSASRFSKIASSRVSSRVSSISSNNVNNSGRNHLQNRLRKVQQSTGVKNAPGTRLKP